MIRGRFHSLYTVYFLVQAKVRHFSSIMSFMFAVHLGEIFVVVSIYRECSKHFFSGPLYASWVISSRSVSLLYELDEFVKVQFAVPVVDRVDHVLHVLRSHDATLANVQVAHHVPREWRLETLWFHWKKNSSQRGILASLFRQSCAGGRHSFRFCFFFLNISLFASLFCMYWIANDYFCMIILNSKPKSRWREIPHLNSSMGRLLSTMALSDGSSGLEGVVNTRKVSCQWRCS